MEWENISSQRVLDTDTPFGTVLRHYFDESSTQDIGQIFYKLQKPVPQDLTESIDGTDYLLVPLTYYGLIIKIDKTHSPMKLVAGNPHTPISHPHIGQPVLSIRCRKTKLEIFPGAILNGVTNDDVEAVHRILHHDHIDFHDSLKRNIALLPLQTDDFPRGYPIVIDEPATKPLDDEYWVIEHLLNVDYFLNPANENTPQYQLYKPLHTAFSEAWQSQDNQKIRDAFELARSFKENGILFSDWVTEDEAVWKYTPHDIKNHSLNYENRLQQWLAPHPR